MMRLGPIKLAARLLLLALLVAVTLHLSCASKKKASYEARKGIKINELTELKVDDSGDATKVVISAKEELSPNVFKLTDPLRVIIDLTDTTLGEIKGPISVNNGLVNDITTSQFDDATSSLSRIVIGFDKAVDYKVTPKENILTISVPKGVASPEVEGSPAVAEETITPEISSTEETAAEEIPEMPEPALDEELPDIPAEESVSEVAEKLPEAPAESAIEELPIEESSPAEEALPVEESVKVAKKIEDIQFETSDMATSIYVTADGDIGEWNDFIIENPTRLVIDLNGIKNAFRGKKKIGIGSAEVDRLRVGEYKDKTRLVIDYPASKKPSYTINKENKRLVVSIFSEVKDAPAEPASTVSEDELPVEDLDAPVAVEPETAPTVEAPRAEESGEVAPEDIDVGGPDLPVVEDEVPEIGADEYAGADEAPVVVDKPAGKKSTVTSLDFKQLKGQGKSQIAIGTTAPASFTTREGSPGTIIVEMNNTFIPKTNLRRFVDTSSFKSAVTKITPKYDGKTNTATFTINLKEQVSYNAYQDGNTLYVDFDIPGSMVAEASPEPSPEEAPAAVAAQNEDEEEVIEQPEEQEEEVEDNQKWAPVKEEFLSDRMESAMPLSSMGQVLAETYGGKRRFVGRRISLDFKNAELRSIFRLLAEVSKFNMIIGDDVSGRITVRLENVPWDQAFAIILQTKGLWFERYGNIVRIAPAEKLRKERETAVASRKAEIEAKPLDVLFKPISYATAGDISQRVKPVLSSRGTVDIDSRTNTLIIRDVKEFLEAAKSLIEKLDTQTPQVSIESRIVEADTTLQKGWGIKWGGNVRFSPASGNPTGLFFPNSVNVSNIAMNYPSAVGSNASAGIALGSLNNIVDLDLVIQLMEQQSMGKLISSPKVTVLDNATASIMAGTKIPFITQTSSSGSNVRFENAVISLNVTPHVTADGAVFMKIAATRNEPDFENVVQQNPTIIQRSINTEVLVKSGNTTVLGGIYKINKGSGHEGLPFLSKIPILGYLFRNWSKTIRREELLIFITPKIIGDERSAIKGGLKN